MYVSMLSVGTLLLGAISSEEFPWFTKLKEHSQTMTASSEEEINLSELNIATTHLATASLPPTCDIPSAKICKIGFTQSKH